MDRDTSRAGLSFPECSECAGIPWPKQYVPSNRAFFHTIADLLVYIGGVMQKHPAPSITFLLSWSAFATGIHLTDFFPFFFPISSGILSVEVQEDMREAANNLVKHFHKPEQEVRCCSSERVP